MIHHESYITSTARTFIVSTSETPSGALVSGLSATIVVGTTAADTSITAEMASS